MNREEVMKIFITMVLIIFGGVTAFGAVWIITHLALISIQNPLVLGAGQFFLALLGGILFITIFMVCIVKTFRN